MQQPIEHAGEKRRAGIIRRSAAGSLRPVRVLAVLLLTGLLLSMLFMLSACGQEEEAELAGPFGPGTGGALGTPITPPYDLYDSTGVQMGQLVYDSNFTPSDPSAPPPPMNMFTGVYLSFTVMPIVGRADTSCRYFAALLARDDGYDITISGERTNSIGLAFYQVNLEKGAERRNLYCATLKNNSGTMINAFSSVAGALNYVQMHAVLNSVSP